MEEIIAPKNPPKLGESQTICQCGRVINKSHLMEHLTSSIHEKRQNLVDEGYIFDLNNSDDPKDSKVTCPCGQTLMMCYLNDHMRSKRHLKKLDKMKRDKLDRELRDSLDLLRTLFNQNDNEIEKTNDLYMLLLCLIYHTIHKTHPVEFEGASFPCICGDPFELVDYESHFENDLHKSRFEFILEMKNIERVNHFLNALLEFVQDSMSRFEKVTREKDFREYVKNFYFGDFLKLYNLIRNQMIELVS